MPAPSGSAATDTANLQTAISETLSKAQTYGLNGGVIQLRAGRYKFTNIDAAAVVRAAIRLRLQGVYGQTVLQYAGDATGYLLTIVNSQWCELCDFDIDMGVGGAGAIRILYDDGAGFAPSQNAIRRVRIDGKNATPVGILVGGEGGKNQNTDFTIAEDVQIVGCTYAEFLTDKPQSYGAQLIRCDFRAGTGGLYGVVCTGGKVFWEGGRISGHAGAAIRAAGWHQAISFRGLNCEAEKRLFIVDAAHSIMATFSELRWTEDAAHADGRVVIVDNSRASLLFHNCNIGVNVVNPPPPLWFDFSSAHPDSKLIWELGDFGSTAVQPFPPGANVRHVAVYTSTDPIVYAMVNL